MDITFVTGNKNKVREAEHILGFPLKVKDIDLDEIQELDVEKVALHKVHQALEVVKQPVMVDDVGIYLDAWKGFPGALVKWILVAGDGKSDLLLKMLKGEKERGVTVRLAIAFHDGKNSHVFVGVIRGMIAEERRGENGFGWDEIFIPEGQDLTYAQMSLKDKNRISHRKEALEKFKIFLQENNYIV